ncbi:class I glutamine amidotransferase-like protein [Aaosphaeria arxii CBS 175.79]|uniref:Class I glutamine amidotransferase-like protein n=1 Tax=Aaosphaeria arxii CBS 175.79 TaxID=1450172 RepID=A0A6A5XPK7_9PLEO|nr:class I glutamine amidotransferase-like protein [Aaosphaeria arxii CBS 175.79]KAF2014846.1 class I glutamine amidotransferase-like protein [Aaosphaeria arxii CBS 175.79]
MARQVLHIAMLNADVPVPNVQPRWPSYGSIFANLLTKAANRIAPSIRIESTEYNVHLDEYPPSLSNVDLLIITGAAASAYDNLDWIRKLDGYVRDVYANHPHVKIFGSCFGHQLIGQSLLKEFRIYAEKDPNGHEVGVQAITLSDDFRSSFQNAPRSDNLQNPLAVPEVVRLQFIHGDHVKIPHVDALPPRWVNLGSTDHCAVQGLYEPGRVFTLQGHFEFDRFVNTEVLKYFATQGWPVAKKEYLEAVDADDDSELVAEMVVCFLLELSSSQGNESFTKAGGLLTPPLIS